MPFFCSFIKRLWDNYVFFLPLIFMTARVATGPLYRDEFSVWRHLYSLCLEGSSHWQFNNDTIEKDNFGINCYSLLQNAGWVYDVQSRYLLSWGLYRVDYVNSVMCFFGFCNRVSFLPSSFPIVNIKRSTLVLSAEREGNIHNIFT